MNARIPYDACPLCGSREMSEVGSADCSGHPLYKPPLPRLQRWLQCSRCTHIFVDGYFSPAALEILFAETPAEQVPGHDLEGARYIWSYVVETVSRLRGAPGGRWLDVGFGNGALLTTAEEFGYDVAARGGLRRARRRLRGLRRRAVRRRLDGRRPRAPALPAARAGARRGADARGSAAAPVDAQCRCVHLARHDERRRQSVLGRDRALPQLRPQAPVRAARGDGLRTAALQRELRYKACMQVIARKTG